MASGACGSVVRSYVSHSRSTTSVARDGPRCRAWAFQLCCLESLKLGNVLASQTPRLAHARTKRQGLRLVLNRTNHSCHAALPKPRRISSATHSPC